MSIPLVCPRCDHKFNYKGDLAIATCSNCGQKIRIAVRIPMKEKIQSKVDKELVRVMKVKWKGINSVRG